MNDVDIKSVTTAVVRIFCSECSSVNLKKKMLLKTTNVNIELPISQKLVVDCIWSSFFLVEMLFIAYKHTNYAVLPKTLTIINSVSKAYFAVTIKGGLSGLRQFLAIKSL